jgi:outer membrane receptor protein involved in Fe transport
VEIVSATGVYEQDLASRRDATNLGVPINLFFLGRLIDAGWADSTLNNEVFSQEIRISSVGDNVIDWTVGGYYRKDDRDWTFKLDGEPSAPYDVLEDYFIIDNKSWAIFGEATWHINDQWELLGGLRYFDTSRSSDFEIWGVLGGPPMGVQSASASEDVVSPKLALTYFPSDIVTLYAQASKGFRAGGANATAPLIPIFNGGLTIDDSFDSETLWNYELGAKTFVFDRRMMLNAYLFLMEWKDRQVAAIDGSGLLDFVVNAGDAESVGLEMEATVNLTDELQLQGSLTFLNTEFKDDVANPVTGLPLTIKGNELPRAADFSAYIALNYVRTLSSGLEGMFNINYTYAGKNFSDAQNIPLFENDSGNILNLRVGIQGEKFGVFLFGQNLTNDDQTFTQGVRDSGAAFGWPTAIAGNYRRPLTYGIEASLRF